ncbi:uncharacterized protein BX663DRAFT_471797 [Cokeromyces recurvatus]|uniref:uncharacterized protein n=1 Tax=Cokeromyces recurvatus TaxID=90255 RepID=UPI0022206219|nr:uncharacterized protein BX663DRAFT_471797 [Cokeromyces recurvatus]KAI7903752.1 hypothetical protein BX663DRAFT_471797 [Cokeromyces recurvatus]
MPESIANTEPESDIDNNHHNQHENSVSQKDKNQLFSGISNLFNGSSETRPINAFRATARTPFSMSQSRSEEYFTPYSYKSSDYFTASTPNSIMDNESWFNHHQINNPIETITPSLLSSQNLVDTHYLSRTVSSSYLDNQSDYEVILDDGTRQKRTISLSTVQMTSSQYLHANLSNNGNNRSFPSTNWSSDKYLTRKEQRIVTESSKLLNDGDTSRDSKNLQPTSIAASSSSSNNDESSDSEDSSTNDNYIKTKKKKLRKQHLSVFKRYKKSWTKFRNQYLTLSHKQSMVLKCSIAYMIGSLFTFVPQLSALCGTHVASHIAATVTVFFNPAKTVGGMVEAAGFCWIYTLAALTLSLASMYTTNYFLDLDMKLVAYSVSLCVWLAGSTFIISYLKVKLNRPSVLTASGLAFMILFSVIVRQGSGNEAEFSFDIIRDTFAIVAIGSAITVAVCVLIWPMTAAEKLKSEIDSSLSSTRILLKLLTKTFLLDTDLPEFTANETLETAIKTHRTSFTALKPALADAKLEFYNLEMQFHARGYKAIVESLERLAQHIGGLKSSCGLQVVVMQQSTVTTTKTFNHYGTINHQKPSLPRSVSGSSNKEIFNVKAGPQRKRMESELKKEKEREQSKYCLETTDASMNPSLQSPSSSSSGDRKVSKDDKIIDQDETLPSKEGALVQFIRTVRSPMKSLAYTCKQTIIHLQARFLGKTTHTTPSFQLMRQNLANAIELFETSQHQALIRFYKRRKYKNHFNQQNMNSDELHSLILNQGQFRADDIFLVYFFVFCLLEFAKELMTLVDVVQYVFEDINESDQSKYVSKWIKCFLKKRSNVASLQGYSTEIYKTSDLFVPNNHNTLNTLHTPAPKTKLRKFLVHLWSFFSKFRTYQFKFAMKSMLTAEAIAVLAFIPATRPYFTEFKLEWTLITVLAVMLPTVGGTNWGAVLRVLATILGCVIAAVTYTIFHDNTLMLWLMTWLISIPSFWVILHHKHGRFGLFTLLAYNLVVLYKFRNRDDDSIDVFELTWMRCVAVSLGVIIGLIVTAYVWPYEARTEVRKGLSDLILRLSWLYKQLVSTYSEDDQVYREEYKNSKTLLKKYDMSSVEPNLYSNNPYLITKHNKERADVLQRIELSIQVNIFELQALLVHAPNEPRLKGPFPAKTYQAMLVCCQNILDKFLSLRIVILKDVWAIHVRRSFLIPVSNEFMEMAGNVFLYFYLLASALQLKTPLPPYLPPAEKTRQRLLSKLQQIPLIIENSIKELGLTEEKKDECYMVYYAYVVLMENIIRELDQLGNHMKNLFGSLVPDDQWARYFGQHTDLERN